MWKGEENYMQSHDKRESVASSFTGQQAKLEVPQQIHRPQFMPPDLFFTEEQEASLNPDILALSEQITQRLPAIDKKQHVSLRTVILIALVLAGILFFIWRPTTAPTTAPAITQQNFNSTVSTGSTINTIKNTAGAPGGQIQVYIVGAVKNPGIYRVETGARVYQLLQEAGGPLPDANLVALNLAAKLSDGQEVYVAKRGESPPTSTAGESLPGSNSNGAGLTASTASTGAPVNINTASVTALEQQLHIARSTAQNIVNYRMQHGTYTSADQLLQVVRKTTYDKIKGMVTV
jgi:competence protein ComEA